MIRTEPESEALRAFLGDWPNRVSSRLAESEVHRALLRAGLPEGPPASTILAEIALLPVDEAALARAGSLLPPALRTLDAIHLASALSLDHGVGAFVSYDTRLAAAAAAAGLSVEAPE